jgi:hypothetical protein
MAESAADFRVACKDAHVSQASCREAQKIEHLADHQEFFAPSYPVERQELLTPLTAELNSLSPEELIAVAKVHERLIAKSFAPPTNGGVEISSSGKITGLTFGDYERHLDVPITSDK